MTTMESIAICLDDREIAVVSRDHAGAPAAVRAAWDGLPASLAAALDPLLVNVPRARAATFVLRRPLAHVRSVPLPNMPRAAAERVLARDWARYVIGSRATDHTVAAVRATHGRWRATFAPTDLLDTLAEIARAQGWDTFDICAGDDVLSDGLARMSGGERSGEMIIIVCDAHGPTDACHVRQNVAIAGRRFVARSNERDVAAFAQANAEGALIAVVGDPVQVDALERALKAQGLSAGAVSMLLPDSTSPTVFATFARRTRHRRLLRSPSMARQRARRFRTATLWVAAAAAAALIVALAMEQRRLASDLDRIHQQRADLSGPVSNAVARRATIQSSVDLVAALAAREREATRTSDVLALVTLALPPGTALTLLNVTGDTLTVEGESAHSAAVYQSLRALPLLAQVKLSSPLRQERQAGDVAVEHFAFNARITPVGAPAARATR